MRRSEMVRVLNGAIQAMDGMKITYKDKALHILTLVESLGMLPPSYYDEKTGKLIAKWEEELLKRLK